MGGSGGGSEGGERGRRIGHVVGSFRGGVKGVCLSRSFFHLQVKLVIKLFTTQPPPGNMVLYYCASLRPSCRIHNTHPHQLLRDPALAAFVSTANGGQTRKDARCITLSA